VLLDLNLPGMSGSEVLEVTKDDDSLRMIPVIVLTSSEADRDIVGSYTRNANCYIVKPVDAVKFIQVVQQVEHFWVDVVCLAPKQG
jgi:CheY-like chemotaxis protein